MKIRLLIAICLLAITLPSINLAKEINQTTDPKVATSKKEPTNISEILLAVGIKNFKPKDTIISYINSTTSVLYVPFQEVFFLLSFSITDTNQSGKVFKGIFFRNKFILDFNKNVVQINNITFKILSDEIFIGQNQEIYLSTIFIEKHFQLIFDINLAKLSIKIDTVNNNNTFADQIKQDNTTRRSGLAKRNKLLTERLYLTNFNRPEWYSNTLGLQYITNYKNHKDVSSLYNNISLSMGGVFGDLDTTINLNYTHKTNGRNSLDSYINFSKPLEHGLFKYFSIGQISSLGITGVSSPKLEPGLYMSSFSNYGVNANKTVTISGPLNVGNQVELYKNNILLDYAEYTNGSFSFNVSEVTFGVNTFKLVFYDPYGGTREEERSYVIDQNNVKTKDIGVKFSLTQSKVTSTITKRNHRKINFNSDLSYGLLDNLAINTFLAIQDNAQNIYLPQNHIIGAGTRLNILGAAISNTVYYNSQNKQTGFGGDAYVSLLGGGLYSGLNYYNNSHTQESYADGGYNKYMLNLRYYTNLKLYRSYIPIFISYVDSTNKKNTRADTYKKEYLVRVSKPISPRLLTSISAILLYKKTSNFTSIKKSVDLYSSYSANSNIILYNKTNVVFRKNRNVVLQIIENSFAYKKNNHVFTAKSIFAKSLTQKYNHTAVLGYSIKKTYGTFGVNGSLERSLYSMSFLYSTSIMYHKSNKTIHTAPDKLQNKQSNIIALLFVDNDLDGQYNKDIDDVIANTKILVNGSPSANASDAKGYLLVSSVAPYSRNQLSLDEKYLQDITLINSVKETIVTGITNATIFTQIAAIKSGSVSGQIYLNKKELKFHKISLQNLRGVAISEAFTNANGYFFIDTIPYGQYVLKTISLNKKEFYTKTFTLAESEMVNNFDLQPK